MKNRGFDGFSLAETLIALGIVGILVVTMISLNSMNDSDKNVALTKFSNVDSALKSWSSALTKVNETGLGVSSEIKDQNTLVSSITDFFNETEIKNSTTTEVLHTDGENIKDYTKVTLENGATLNVKYLADGKDTIKNGDDTFSKNIHESNIALVSISVPVGKTNETIDEEYVLKNQGINNIDEMYKGFKKVEVKPIIGTDGNPVLDGDGNPMYGYNPSAPAGNTDPCTIDSCTVTTAEGKYVYIKNAETLPCGEGMTGVITKQTQGSIHGTYSGEDTSKCCVAPKIHNGAKCSCDGVKVAAGYVKDDASDTCAAIALPGSYANDGNFALCDEGHYCPQEGMIASVICPKGSYCPNYDKKQAKKNYHNLVFAEKTPAKGGVINSIICPKGYYCPEEGLTAPIICPKGAYCPTEGLSEPVKCPAGTYGKFEGKTTKTQACTACPENFYCPNLGMNDDADDDNSYIKFPCDTANGEFSKSGATSCTVCPAGKYLRKDNSTKFSCQACPVGTYGDEAGLTKCKPCPAGSYNNKTGQTSCTLCSPKYYQAETGKTSCTACPRGHYCAENGMVTPDKCPINTYNDKLAQVSCTACPSYKHTITVGAENANSCICNATKPDDFVLEEGAFWDPNNVMCYNFNKIYVIAAYNNSIWAGWYGTDYLTIEDDIRDFTGLNNYSGARHSIFSGAGQHNWNNANDDEWIELLNKMTDEVKNTPMIYGEAFLINPDGTILGVVASDQVGVASYATNAYHSASYLFDDEFEVIESLNVDGGWGASEEGSGGKIRYKGKIYTVVHTIFRKETPIVLDLKGNGYKFTNVENGVNFDLNADGNVERTAWTAAQNTFDDVFLVLDRNENGTIDSGIELFGSQNGAENGFAELAKFDDNLDGIINEIDPIYEKLQVWADMNKDGISTEDELKSLSDVNVIELSVQVTASYNSDGDLNTDAHGNTTGLTGKFKMLVERIINGVLTFVETVRSMVDVLFNTTT